MAFTNPIAKYQLYYYGKRRTVRNYIAKITLRDSRNRYVGSVDFYRDGQAIPNNSAQENINPKIITLNMHERQIDSVVDMLRNEKPCSMFYNSPTLAGIRTGTEPIGEEES